MTDARFPERWLNDRRLARITGTEFRGFVAALAWCVANRTDGHIHEDEIVALRWCDKDVLDTLLLVGLAQKTADGYYLTDYEETQTAAAELDVLDNLRRRDRTKKRRQRAHKDGDHSLCGPSTCAHVRRSVPGETPGTFPGDVPGDWRGQDRTGQARQKRR